MPFKSLSIFYFVAATFFFISCHKSGKLFTSLSSSDTNIRFANNLEKREGFGILYYLYYYNGGGVATGDINNDGLPDIYFTANSNGGNKLYLNKGDFKFEDITEKAGVAGASDWCSGVTMADVNGDGFVDIYVCAVSNAYGLKGRNQLFINNGNGSFTESAAKYGLDFSGYSVQASFFDYDHDGDLDCFLLNESLAPNEKIVDTSYRRKFDPYAGGRLYRNEVNASAHKFTDVSGQAGIYQSSVSYGLGLAVADINNDGWEDIYVGNDFHENDYYYINNHNGTFTESGASHFKHYSRFSMGNDVADYNNDGNLDIITVDMLPPDEPTLKTYGSDDRMDIYNYKIINPGYQPQYSRNCLQRNNGDGISFSDVGLIAGVSATDWSWSALMNDFDNDGNKDIFISSGIVKRPGDLDYIRFVSDLSRQKGMEQTTKYDEMALEKMPDGASHPFFFKNNGKSGFANVSDTWGTSDMKGYFNGASYADLNNDGNMDVVINCINAPAVVLKNNAEKKNYISISFKGDNLNSQGIGAKAYLFAAGKMQYQQLMPTRGFQSASEPRLHFGLDTLSRVDSLLIVWPNQKFQVIKNVSINKQLLVGQKDAPADFNYELFFPKRKQVLEDISTQVQCNWKHKEDDFNDFSLQYLIPHEESTRGPKLAVADVNKDGLDDFFVCGAKGQPGCLMLQTKNGKFLNSDTAVFNKNRESEGVDAVFFDANNDGYMDLYTVSGGNEYEDGNINLADHLYLNNGKGHFEESKDALPKILTNKSCVSYADIDKDGDIDLFVGVLANAKTYGLPQSSNLLLNDGKGHFTLADQSMINLKEIGMVTTSAFADINNDGWTDLLVTGEWMPVKVFINSKGTFVSKDLDHSSGLWQTIYSTDVNGDGFTDILAGNWGQNSKLYAGKDGPLKLYVKDFDKNGTVEQVMAYTVNGQEYTFLPKDELEQSLPVLKKAYLTYGEVAGKTVQYMFYDLFKDYKELKAETLASSCFINDGKGNFKRIDLPQDVQLAPVFTFAPAINNGNTYLAAGNFYGVFPYEGRYDALPPTFFSYKKQMVFNSYSNLPAIDGEVRDAKWLTYSTGDKVLILARNNKELLFFKPRNKE
ncbi:VCBS repeat-containing protein [Segetibacter koreensis]|uniref:VCBS repeat-containing protein n=1 Tax=Segetibacter koreensis TaxID=398037 RepID=UPI000370399A|nr:VCBS repeat-containing protein [Segetibacter koreensis]